MPYYAPTVANTDTLAATIDFDGLKDTPWESIAHLVPKNATVAEILRAAQLDWEVLRLPLSTDFPTLMKGDHVVSSTRMGIPKAFCLVRKDTRAILTPYMGDRYKPVQNDYAFGVFDQFIKAGEMRMTTAGSLHEGKHIWGLAATNDQFALGDGEIVQCNFLLVQSHAYGYSLRAMLTPIRYPGGHSTIASIPGLKGGFYTMPHSRVFDEARIEEIKGVLTKSEEQFQAFKDKAVFMADTDIEERDGVMVLAQLFDQKLLRTRKLDKEVLPETYEELFAAEDACRKIKKVAGIVQDFPGSNLDSCNGTAWGLYQGISHAIDYEMGHNANTRLEASWLGKDNKTKLKALDLSIVAASKRINV